MAEGNPLFMEQLAAIVIEDGAEIGMASSIRGVLQARLDRLGQAERVVLERASVVGRSFSLAALLELIPPEERELAQSHIFDLARRGLVRPDTTDPQVGFRFQHALIRDAVYEAMPKTTRADLHEEVAAWVETAGDPEALVGFHLEKAYLLRKELGRHDAELGMRAGRLLQRAAETASSKADGPATISLLERARVVLPADDPELPLLLTALGSARVNAGDLPGAARRSSKRSRPPLGSETGPASCTHGSSCSSSARSPPPIRRSRRASTLHGTRSRSSRAWTTSSRSRERGGFDRAATCTPAAGGSAARQSSAHLSTRTARAPRSTWWPRSRACSPRRFCTAQPLSSRRSRA